MPPLSWGHVTNIVIMWHVLYENKIILLNGKFTHCRVEPKEVQPGCCRAVEEEGLHQQHAGCRQGNFIDNRRSMAQTEGPSHILIIYKVDRSGDWLAAVFVLQEMKDQMSIPPAASDQKNKQVTVTPAYGWSITRDWDPAEPSKHHKISVGSSWGPPVYPCTCNCCCDLQALLGERGAQGPIWQPGADKYSRLDHQLQNANSQFIEEQQVQQQVQEHLRNLNKLSTFTMPLKCFLSLIADCGAAGGAAGACVRNHRSPEEHVGANRHGAGWAGRVRTECNKRGGWERHVTTKCQKRVIKVIR